MKALVTTLILSLGISSTAAYANEKETSNMNMLSQLCKNVFETKEFNKLDNYIAKDFVFYKNFSQPLDYVEYKKNLVEQGSSCKKISLLPFENMIAAGDKVALQYTRSCTDASNIIHQRRVMAIAEINAQHKISKIWIVTHEKVD